MLPSVLIKVKSWDVTGQEGDAGSLPWPHVYIKVQRVAERKTDLRSSKTSVPVRTCKTAPKYCTQKYTWIRAPKKHT